VKRILAGPRAVGEALGGPRARDVAVVLVDRKPRKELRRLVGQARERGVRVEERERAELDAVAGDLRHQGIVAIAGEYPYAPLDAILSAHAAPLVVALDSITDPHNFGAIVRAAVALGADGVVTTRNRAAPVTPAVVRASAGATEHARIARVTNLARTLGELSESGLDVVGLDAEGDTSLRELPPAEEGRVLVVGSEGRGMRRLVRERCDRLARIELPGPVASLNASVAAAIALWEASRDRS